MGAMVCSDITSSAVPQIDFAESINRFRLLGKSCANFFYTHFQKVNSVYL